MNIHYQALRMYHALYLIRCVEEKVIELFDANEIHCPTHLSIGQEAPAAALAQLLEQENRLVFTTHRSHAHYLAFGGSLTAFFAELFGRSGGCSGGWGGSMHLVDQTAGILGSSSIVGGIVPIATGVAWAEKLAGSGKVVMVFFGDAAMEEGVVYEAMNIAVLKNLPIIFVCEDNGWATYTPKSLRQPHHEALFVRAQAFMPARQSQSDNVEAIFTTASMLLDVGGPSFLHVPMSRFSSHVLTAQKNTHYDTAVPGVDYAYLQQQMEEACPVRCQRQRLLDRNCGEEVLQKIERDVDQVITAAVSAAQEQSHPVIESMHEHAWTTGRGGR